MDQRTWTEILIGAVLVGIFFQTVEINAALSRLTAALKEKPRED